MKRHALFLGALACATAPLVWATPVAYDLFFTVEYLRTEAGFPPHDPRVQIGDVYTGSFTVDSALLATDGSNLAGNVSAFSISTEDVTWTMGLQFPLSEFAGFRGPGGLGADSPGFDVAGGQVTNLRGGVYGRGDVPFVDFSVDARPPYLPNDPACTGLYCGNRSNYFWTVNQLGAFGGPMTVAAPVPEPETYAMSLIGLIGVFVAVQRRKAGGAPKAASEG